MSPSELYEIEREAKRYAGLPECLTALRWFGTTSLRLIAEIRSLQTQLAALAQAFVQQVPEHWGAYINLAPGQEKADLFEALNAAKERE